MSASLYPSKIFLGGGWKKKGTFNKEGECDFAHVMKTERGKKRVAKPQPVRRCRHSVYSHNSAGANCLLRIQVQTGQVPVLGV